MVILNEKALDKIIKPPVLREEIRQKRMCFLEDSIWKRIGLPTE